MTRWKRMQWARLVWREITWRKCQALRTTRGKSMNRTYRTYSETHRHKRKPTKPLPHRRPPRDETLRRVVHRAGQHHVDERETRSADRVFLGGGTGGRGVGVVLAERRQAASVGAHAPSH